MWLVTGSLLSLCFAALGPVMIVANALDGVRAKRKHDRLARARRAKHWARATEGVKVAHTAERDALLLRSPDVAAASESALLAPEAMGPLTELVVGRGAAPSEVRVTGSEESDEAQAFVARAREIADAPVAIPLATAIHVRGSRVAALATVRGLAAQLLLRSAPGSLAFTGGLADELGLGGVETGHVVVVTDRADTLPATHETLWLVSSRAQETPPGMGATIDVTNPEAAMLTTREGRQQLVVEALSNEQFAEIAARHAHTSRGASFPERVDLAELATAGRAGSLRVALGVSGSGEFAVDLVSDGPHAVVTGVTGTGKSELLCTWVASLAREYGPEEVTFVLADFKGGMAFEPLRVLPHTAAIMTDMDAAEVARGVQSLRAEMRRRAALLAHSGARDVSGLPGMARLIVIVDEFAAMMHDHAELAAIFTDIAARGRALGVHLILGTQRATGAVRDGLLANCPLRICLRALEVSESRFVLGTDAAFELPGGVRGRGLAEIKRASDSASMRIRIAQTSAETLTHIASAHAGAAAVASPWLPRLPAMLRFDELAPTAREGGLVLGLCDDPAGQRQFPLVVERTTHGIALVGGSRSGKSTTLAVILEQAPDAVVVPRDPEGAWNLICGEAGSVRADSVVLCDDIDLLTAQFSPEQASVWVAAWERQIRSAAEAGGIVVLAATRLTAGVARLIDLLPLRALLATANRAEHLALGGSGETWQAERAPGRAIIRGLETQLAFVATSLLRVRDHGRGAAAWQPRHTVHAIVAPAAARVTASLKRSYPQHTIATLAEFIPGTTPEPCIVVGDADSWLRQPALWQHVRTTGSVLLPATQPSLLRTLGGSSAVPPYASATHDRMWEVTALAAPQVVRVEAFSAASG